MDQKYKRVKSLHQKAEIQGNKQEKKVILSKVSSVVLNQQVKDQLQFKQNVKSIFTKPTFKWKSKKLKATRKKGKDNIQIHLKKKEMLHTEQLEQFERTEELSEKQFVIKNILLRDFHSFLQRGLLQQNGDKIIMTKKNLSQLMSEYINTIFELKQEEESSKNKILKLKKIQKQLEFFYEKCCDIFPCLKKQSCRKRVKSLQPGYSRQEKPDQAHFDIYSDFLKEAFKHFETNQRHLRNLQKDKSNISSKYIDLMNRVKEKENLIIEKDRKIGSVNSQNKFLKKKAFSINEVWIQDQNAETKSKKERIVELEKKLLEINKEISKYFSGSPQFVQFVQLLECQGEKLEILINQNYSTQQQLIYEAKKLIKNLTFQCGNNLRQIENLKFSNEKFRSKFEEIFQALQKLKPKQKRISKLKQLVDFYVTPNQSGTSHSLQLEFDKLIIDLMSGICNLYESCQSFMF